MEFRLAIRVIRLVMTGLVHATQVPLRWASSVARHAGGSWLRCRVAGLGVSLLVHVPLVWVLATIAPLPLPVESGIDSIAAVTARNQPAVAAAITVADSWPTPVTDTVPLTRDVVRHSDLLSGALQPVATVSAPPAIRVLQVDVSHRLLSHKNVRRPPRTGTAVVWPVRLTVSEFARRWTTSPVANPTGSPDGIPRSPAAGPTASPRSDAARPQHSAAKSSAAKSSAAKPPADQAPAAEPPRATRPAPLAADVAQASQPRNLEPPNTVRPPVARPPSSDSPRRDAAEPDQAAQDRHSVASRRSSGRQVDQLPRKLPRNPQPVYPVDAWRAGRAGRVVLLVRVDDRGHVQDARVHNSSGTRSLDNAALEAVRRWKFRPALSGNRPVEHQVLVPVRFRIER